MTTETAATAAAATTSAGAAPSPHQSRIPELLEGYYAQICRMDELEARLEDRVTRTRRRITNVLDLVPRQSHRATHVRLFVSHSLNSTTTTTTTTASNNTSDAAPAAAAPASPMETPLEYQLLMEGRLLVDHLDHASAAAFDKRTKYTPPNDDDKVDPGEDDQGTPPAVNFTHLFDNVTIEFQPYYQPKPHPMARIKKAPTPTKSGRRGAASFKYNQADSEVSAAVDPSTLIVGPSTRLGWTRNMTPDAQAWVFQYTPPPPPGHHLQQYQVVCRIHLLPHRPEEMYRASSKLASFMFPSHGPSPASLDKANNHKRKAEDMMDVDTSMNEPPPVPSLPPMDNEIDIPQGLTMRQVTHAFFTYIQDHNLATDPADKSIVHCDATLGALFQTDRLMFSQLQQLLLQHQLLLPMTRAPVELTYVMRPTNAEVVLSEEEQPAAAPQQYLPSILQIDLDVAVPSLFAIRARHLLNRSQRRLADQVAARTKARAVLLAGTSAGNAMASNATTTAASPPPAASRKANATVNTANAAIVKQYDDAITRLMDQALVTTTTTAATGNMQHGLDEKFIPLYAALSKGAPPNSEASRDALLDRQLCYLVGQLQQECQSEAAAWEVVHAALAQDGGSK